MLFLGTPKHYRRHRPKFWLITSLCLGMLHFLCRFLCVVRFFNMFFLHNFDNVCQLICKRCHMIHPQSKTCLCYHPPYSLVLPHPLWKLFFLWGLLCIVIVSILICFLNYLTINPLCNQITFSSITHHSAVCCHCDHSYLIFKFC